MVYFFSNLIDSLTELIQLSQEIFALNFQFILLSFNCLFSLFLILLGLLIINYLLIRLVLKLVPAGDPGILNIAFFHPYCNAGGGGERVLWTSIQAIQSRFPLVKCYVYTGDTDATPAQIMENVQHRFNIHLERNPHFIYLNFRVLVEANCYPFFTLLMQSLGSVLLGAEALSKFRPQIFIDSMGYAFTYPLFRFIGGSFVASYTHYPTISTDMLGKVSDRIEAHNNRSFISESCILSFFKLSYYYIFAVLYGIVGSCSQVVMVNSSWTKSHISYLWRLGPSAQVVFPPCNTSEFSNLPIEQDDSKDLKTIVSIGQFRPEKNYPLQLNIFKDLLLKVNPEIAQKLRLVLIGGVRNLEDEKRVEALKTLALDLNIEDKVIWKINASFPELLHVVQKGTIGIHTMWNEHFGIGVVECMAGGLIIVAHNSGGPKMDIVTPYEGKVTGFLASTSNEYVENIINVLNLSSEEKTEIRNSARLSMKRFSEEVFKSHFLSAMQTLIDPQRTD